MSDEQKAEALANSQTATADFLEGLYGDPYRPETSRNGRHLVIASAISIAASIFNVKLTGTSLIPVDFGARADVLPMLLSLAVLLLGLSFALRAVADLLRDREIGLLVLRYIESVRVQAARKAAQEAEEGIYSPQHDDEDPGGPDPWWEPYIKLKEASDAAVEKAEENIGARDLPRFFRKVRRVIEVALPIAFAIVALRISWKHFVSLGDALWHAL